MASAETPVNDVEVHSQKRCTYCFQELCDMTDPRLLPCQHIVCLICLQEDWKLDKLECRACSKSVTVSIEELPKVIVRDQSCSSGTTGLAYVCGSNEADGKTASAYCTDCGKLMCREHEEFHKKLFGDDHQVISIDVYAGKPDFFAIHHCTTHTSKPISMSCQKCDQLFCVNCALDTCKTGDDHSTIPLATARISLEAHFAEMIKKCSEKVTELCKLEKRTWQTVDELNEKCEAMIKQVDLTAEKQIAEISKRATGLKQEVEDYRITCLEKVEQYVIDLRRKAEELESNQEVVKKFLRESNTATMIMERRIRDEEFIEAHGLDTSTPLHCVEQAIIKNGAVLCFADMEQYRLRPLPLTPESVVYQRELNLPHGNVCFSVMATRNKVTFGCSQSILLYNSQLQYESHASLDNGLVRSVASRPASNQIYYLSSNRAVEYMPATFMFLKEQLMKFSSSNNYSSIAVNDRYVAVSNAKGYKLYVYRFSSKTSQPYFAGIDKEWLRSLKFHPDGDLITLNNDSWIRKYRLSDTVAPELIWESRTTDNKAYALCVEQKTGLVFVTGANHMLYIISAGVSVSQCAISLQRPNVSCCTALRLERLPEILVTKSCCKNYRYSNEEYLKYFNRLNQ